MQNLSLAPWRRVPVALAAALLLVTACSDPVEPFHYEGTGGVPVAATFYSDVPLVPVSVEGQPALDFLMDTGAPATLLDPDALDLPAGRYRPARLGFLDITALDPLLGVTDLFGDDLAVAGILGGDLLRHFAITIDYRGTAVVLYPDLAGGVPSYGDELDPALQVGFHLRGGGILPLTADQRLEAPATRILVALEIEGHAVDAMLDTGASAVVLRESLFDQLLSERPERPVLEGPQVVTVDGALASEMSRAATLALSGVLSDSARHSVETQVVRGSTALQGLSDEVGQRVDALLGASYLRWFQLTVDYPARTLTLQPYQNPDHVDPDQWITVGFNWYETASGAVWVDTVYPGTDAAVEGVEPGDRIVKAGNRVIALQGGAGVAAAVDASALGDHVPFTFERDETSYPADIEIEDLLPAFE